MPGNEIVRTLDFDGLNVIAVEVRIDGVDTEGLGLFGIDFLGCGKYCIY